MSLQAKDNPEIPVSDSSVYASQNYFPDLPDSLDKSSDLPPPPTAEVEPPKEEEPDVLPLTFDGNITNFFSKGNPDRVIVITEPTWCAPCRLYENIINDSSLSHGEGFNTQVQVIETDVHTKLKPIFEPYITGYPCTIKLVEGRVIMRKGVLSLKELENFLPKRAIATANPSNPSNEQLRQMTFRELRQFLRGRRKVAYVTGMTVTFHLTQHHRFDATRISGLSNQELLLLHGKVHENES